MRAPSWQPTKGSSGLLASALAVLVAVGVLGADRTSAEVWLVAAQATDTATPTAVPGEPPRAFGPATAPATPSPPTPTPPFRGEPPRGFAPIPTRTPIPPPTPVTPVEPPPLAGAPDSTTAPPAGFSTESPAPPAPIATLQVPQLPPAGADPLAPIAAGESPPTTPGENPDQPPFIAVEPGMTGADPTPTAMAAAPPEPQPTAAAPPTPVASPAAPSPAPTPTTLVPTTAPQVSPTISAISVLATVRRRLERASTPEVPASQQCLSPSDVRATNRDGSPVTALQTLASAPNELTLGCANTTSGVALGWSPLTSAPGPITYTVFRCPLQIRPESGACTPLLSAGRPELVGPLDAGFDYYVEALDGRGATYLSNRFTLRR